MCGRVVGNRGEDLGQAGNLGLVESSMKTWRQHRL
jgi:hypothetical protein